MANTDSPQLTQEINNAQNNPIGLIKALVDVVQNNQQNNQQISSLNKQDQTQAIQNAFQKGAAKALSEHGYNKMNEALSTGIDPNALANHPAMQQSNTPAMSLVNGGVGNVNGDQIIDPKQIISGILSAASIASSPNTSNIDNSNNINNSPIQNKESKTNINNNLSYKSDNPVSSFFNMLGITPTPEAQALLTQAQLNRQKIAAGNPAEIALPQAQASEIQQKIAGAEPLQPKDIAELTAGTYKAGLEATHQALASEVQKFNSLQDLYGKLNETKGRTNQILATPSQEQKTLYKSLQTVAKNINTHVANLGVLINNRPKFSKSGLNPQTQGIVNEIKEGQTATNPKTGQTIVYRGGKWMNQ